MKVTVLFFGKVADVMGERQRVHDVSNTQARLFALRESLLGQAFTANRLDVARVQMSVNQVRVTDDRPLSDGDEVAFFPVFSGG